MSLLEAIGIVPQHRRDQQQTFRKIEASGGVDILKRKTEELREQGDVNAHVVDVRDNLTRSHVMVQLRWGLLLKPELSASTWWHSKGVALESTPSTDVKVRFTRQNGWSYLRFTPTWELKMYEQFLDKADLDKLQTISSETPLPEQIDLAMKIARHLGDYRFGEGQKSLGAHLKTGPNFRVLL